MKVFVFDGLIGAGKTTVMKHLTEHLTSRGHKVHPVYEPVDEWRKSGMLGWFYEDPSANSYAFQTYVYTTRVQAILSAAKEHPDSILLLERSPETDRLFMEMLREAMLPALYQAYQSWCSIHDQMLPFKISDATFVYLRPSLDVCMRRLRDRARDEESGVGEDYQRKLMAYHDRRYLLESDVDNEYLVAMGKSRKNIVIDGGALDREMTPELVDMIADKMMLHDPQ